MAHTIYRGNADEVRAIVQTLVSALAGRIPDPWSVVQVIQVRMGIALLSKIQQAFLIKSRGSTGDDGIHWAPLKRATIAQRRVTREERKAAGITGRRVRGLLTPAQDKKWRAIFASRVARLRALGVADAEARAAQIAWAVLKSEGAQTKLALFGGRQVDIGRDTDVMFRSLSPGVEDRPSHEPDQVFDMPPGQLIVGTNVPYAEHFHARRPLWPPDGNLPPTWASAVAAAGARGLALALVIVLGQGGQP